MNFLAHLILSGDDDKLKVGNFIADFVKGRQALEKFEPRIIQGIMLHRIIDEFTDHHPVVSESKNRLREKYRHYSGVIVDVFYDHFLAMHWNDYHTDPLDVFAQNSYQLISNHDHILPEGVKYMLPYMIRGNWLVNYSKREGINRALTGISRRTPYLSKMDEAIQDLVEDEHLYYAEFQKFFPELQELCEKTIRDFSSQA